MKATINLDIDLEAGFDVSLVDPLREALENYFEQKNYGEEVTWIAIILVCRPSHHGFKVRKRFEKATRVLYYDVMINFESAKDLPIPEKKKLVHEALQRSIELVMDYKKKIKDFDFDAFKKDWKKFFWEFEWV